MHTAAECEQLSPGEANRNTQEAQTLAPVESARGAERGRPPADEVERNAVPRPREVRPQSGRQARAVLEPQVVGVGVVGPEPSLQEVVAVHPGHAARGTAEVGGPPERLVRGVGREEGVEIVVAA